MTQEDWDWIESKRQEWKTDNLCGYVWDIQDTQAGWVVYIASDWPTGRKIVGRSGRVFISLIEAARAAYADAFPGEG